MLKYNEKQKEKYLKKSSNSDIIFVTDIFFTIQRTLLCNPVRGADHLCDEAISIIQMSCSTIEWLRGKFRVRQGRTSITHPLQHIFLGRVKHATLEEHGYVSIGRRTISNLRCFDVIDAVAEEHQKLNALVETLFKVKKRDTCQEDKTDDKQR